MSLESDLFATFETKLLLLTGAGASKPLDMPLMREFYDLVSAKGDRVQRELLHNIFMVHDKETQSELDLEALLSLLERYRGLYDIMFGDSEFGYFAHLDSQEKRERAKLELEGPLGERGQSIPEGYLSSAFGKKEVLENLDALVRDLVFEVYGRDFKHHLLDELYLPLTEVTNKYFPQKLIPIFTTNYDASIETYAIRTDIKLETGFEPTHTGNIWKPARFYEFQPVEDKQNMLLFKLHGSLTWQRKGDKIISTGLSMKDPSGYKSAVMYPTQTKEYPDEEPFRTMYNFLKACFRVAKVAIVIGYSFRDPGIHRIMTDALELNPELFFVLICGSNVERWKKFGQQNLRSYRIIPQYFDFASKGAPYLEELNMALAELQTRD